MLTMVAPGEEIILATNIVTGTANVYGTMTQLSASTANAYYIVGVLLLDITGVPIYIGLQLYTGASGSEVLSTTAQATGANVTQGITNGQARFFAPLLIASGTRVAAKTICSAATHTIATQLIAIQPANLSDPTDSTIATNLDATVSSRLATSGYTAPDNATIAAIDAKTTNLPPQPADVTDIPTEGANADALLDRANAIDINWTPRQAWRQIAAATAGKLSGAPTGPIVLRNLEDTLDRATWIVDAHGNRISVTYVK